MRSADVRMRSIGESLVRRRSALACVLLMALLVGCGRAQAEPPPGDAPLRVAWINQGHAGSEPWTTAHAAAVNAVAEEFGDRVETTFVEGVALGDEADATIDRLVSGGTTLIFATSYPLHEHVERASRRHPEVRFAQARGIEVSENLGAYSGAHEEPIYLAGMAGASVSQSGTIGFVATAEEPETVRHINAYTLGARAVNPDVEVEVAWVNSWWDMETERELAELLVSRGADVLATGCTSPATGEVAREAGVAWSSHDADRSEEFSDVWLTSSLPDWTNYYRDSVAAALEGKWEGTAYYGSMADGFAELAPLGTRVPGEAARRIERRRAEMVEGAFDVFGGPLRDETGTLRVPAGHTLPFEERMDIDWLVEGVEVVVPSGPLRPPT